MNMNENNEPVRTSYVVGQALAWLDKLNIPYRYAPEANLWEIVYEGRYLLLINDSEDNEMGIMAPVYISESDDERIQDMVYECSVPILESELSPDCDFCYHGNGLCRVSQWWVSRREQPRLTKKFFSEKLKEMHDTQLRFGLILRCVYEAMFNTPREKVEEVLRDLRTD